MTTSINETILGFNPVSDEISVFEIEVTPQIAQYILIHHNRDNRKVTNSQVNKIAKSVRSDGWLRDGQPLTFNVEGNITEGQHRLHAIVAEDVTVQEQEPEKGPVVSVWIQPRRASRSRLRLFLLANGMYAIPMALRRVPPDVDGLDSHPGDWETKVKRAQVPRDMKYRGRRGRRH